MEFFMSKTLLLSEYDPVSMLNVPVSEVPKPKFPVLDAHIHIGELLMDNGADDFGDIGVMVSRLKESGVIGVVNLKMFWGELLREHLKALEGYEDFIYTFASVDVTRCEEPDFAVYADDMLKQFKTMGIRGVKLWKNIGCTLKDSGGAYLGPDDSRLRPIWDAAAKYGLLVLFHIADPVSFFTPVDKHNEFYEQLCEHPEWSFYDDDTCTGGKSSGGGKRYSFEDLMQRQDALLSSNPDTTFIIPHVGSCAEDLSWVGAQLTKHPNMYIDIAARINLLGRQPFSAREFFINHQDRILFGTDYWYDGSETDTRAFFADHYRFLETFDEYFRPIRNWGWSQGRWNIYGLGLPDEVLNKVYSGNALKLLG